MCLEHRGTLSDVQVVAVVQAPGIHVDIPAEEVLVTVLQNLVAKVVVIAFQEAPAHMEEVDPEPMQEQGDLLHALLAFLEENYHEDQLDVALEGGNGKFEIPMIHSQRDVVVGVD